MEYQKWITLRDGRSCCLRQALPEDAGKLLAHTLLTHGQTDYLLTYPDELALTEVEEAELIQAKLTSPKEIFLIAVLGDKIIASAGLMPAGRVAKTSHRGYFGISVDQNYWQQGVGRALSEACISCARQAGYSQLELSVLEENRRAVALYHSLGFSEYGCNPRGFRTRSGAYQSLLDMRLELS